MPPVAWWVEYEGPKFGDPAVGAIFISPPDVDRPGSDPRLARFGACSRETLPFPSYLVVKPDLPMLESECRLRALMLKVREETAVVLDSITLADAIQPIPTSDNEDLIRTQK